MNQPSEDDIVRAHDILDAIANREIQIGLSEEALQAINLQRTVLCWLLGHERGKLFEGVVNSLDNLAESHGYKLRKEFNGYNDHR